MALTWDQTKKLTRLQSTANELVVAARRAADSRHVSRQTAVSKQLDAVIGEIRSTLEGSEDLSREFDAIAGSGGGATGTEAQAVAVFGWIKGAVDAEALEMRIREEARAYGVARAEAETRS